MKHNLYNMLGNKNADVYTELGLGCWSLGLKSLARDDYSYSIRALESSEPDLEGGQRAALAQRFSTHGS